LTARVNPVNALRFHPASIVKQLKLEKLKSKKQLKKIDLRAIFYKIYHKNKLKIGHLLVYGSVALTVASYFKSQGIIKIFWATSLSIAFFLGI
jgi:hypothetical protein